MTLSDIKPRDNTQKNIFNPLKKDFICPLRDDHNIYHDYKIRSMEIESFPAYLADILINHLVNEVQIERNINPLNQEAIDEIRKEVIVDEL
jgi:hypothetical protein